MSYYVFDVEADGPCPGLYSMVSIGIVKLQAAPLDCTFYGEFAPITDQYIPEALAVSNISREQHLKFDAPEVVVPRLLQWVEETNTGRAVAISDNPAFDWQFLNYYLHRYAGRNPFGHSARRIGDFYAGLQKNFAAQSNWKQLRRTKHTHNPVDDAKGNAEALLEMQKKFGLKIV